MKRFFLLVLFLYQNNLMGTITVRFFETCNKPPEKWQIWILQSEEDISVKKVLEIFYKQLPPYLTMIHKIEHNIIDSSKTFNWLDKQNANKKIKTALENSTHIVWVYTQYQKMEYTLSKREE